MTNNRQFIYNKKKNIIDFRLNNDNVIFCL